MKDTNLFNWATGELSQDGFICWLLSFAKNPGSDPQLEACAWDFLHQIPVLATAKKITNIERQVAVKVQGKKTSDRIDVLLTVDDYKIIIEDKIFSSADDSQIDRYVAALKGQGEKNVEGVFYKPVSQGNIPKHFIFNRGLLFSIFNPYRNKINNDIFSDYLEYLDYFEDEENAYKNLPIDKWNGNTYRGFFEHLKNIGLVPKSSGYNYVANVGGGFMGMYFNCWKSPQQVKNFNFQDKHFISVYLQLENNKICVKMDLNGRTFDKSDVRYAWETVRNYFKGKLGAEFEFVRFAFSKGESNARWMTIGHILYNEKNYQQQIEKMQDLFKAL